MHRGGSQQLHGGNGRNPARVDTQDQQHPANDLEVRHGIGQPAGKPHLGEELGRAGQREHEQLGQAMGQVHHAQRQSQQQDGIGSRTGIDHVFLQ
ncbi:Uncharacterised protein [Bordetella pertussis]|nr:Uncharacterised protein [Bordetella pertussis]